MSGLGANLAQSLNNSFEDGPKVFGQSLYAGLGGRTDRGLDMITHTANDNRGGLQGAYNWNTGLVNSGGLTKPMKDNIGALGSVGNNYGNLYTQAGGKSLTEQQLMGVAQGKQFGQAAPGYAQVRQNALDDALSGVGTAFTANGRFGSSVMGDAAGQAATGVLSNLDYQNYQNDIGRQERALAAIEGQRQEGFVNQMGALAGQSGALQNQFQMGQQGIANAGAAAAAAPGLFQATLAPGQAIMQAGQVQDAANQAQLLAEADLFDRTENAGFNHAAQYLGALNALNGQPGTQQQTPWWQQALGFGANLASNFVKPRGF